MNSEPRILATRCHTANCRPTIMVSENGAEIVIVGHTVHALLSSRTVTENVGDNEAAIVIPCDLLLEAVDALKR